MTKRDTLMEWLVDALAVAAAVGVFLMLLLAAPPEPVYTSNLVIMNAELPAD
jgi:hypothetical protein